MGFIDDIEVFNNMLDDYTLTEEDYYNKFVEICDRYNEHSIEPYNLFCYLLEDEIPMESYYLQALMDVYSFYAVDDSFLDTLETVIDTGYCKQYIDETHENLKEYIKDGYIVAYRGEFVTGTRSNLDYKESVSYSLDYEEAKFFATRFRGALQLKKSVVYTVKVPIEDVVAYIERESEVVCIPVSRGGKMEVIKEESML